MLIEIWETLPSEIARINYVKAVVPSLTHSPFGSSFGVEKKLGTGRKTEQREARLY